MKFAIIVAVVMGIAFLTGIVLMIIAGKPKAPQAPVTREYTPSGMSAVPTGTITATILGSVTIIGPIPPRSTINVEVKPSGAVQFTTVVQNLPATSSATFTYTKATSGASYDMKVTLLDETSKVIGTSQQLTVTAPTLNAPFRITTTLPVASPTPVVSPSATPSAQTMPTPTPTRSTSIPPTPSPTPTPAQTSLSGNISYHGQSPINSKIVIFQQLANGSGYQIAIDNLTPIDGAMWSWPNATSGKSYMVIAILKQRLSDGSDKDIAASAPVTVTAPGPNTVLTVNSAYTLTKPTATPSVVCNTYYGGANQNYWDVTVNYPAFTGALSYWLEIGSTAGANDIANTYGSGLSVTARFNNNTTYFARYAYAAVAGVDTGSGQYSVFSDSTQLRCGN